MPSDHVERRAAAGAYPPPQQAESLPCPRCDSTNTKFCYYNNYNLQQPRHFCKSCRRYWTHGGALRNIPVGGTSRKTPKRSRPSSDPTNPSNGAVSGHESFTLPPGPQGPTGFLALGGYGFGPIAGFDPMGLYGNWGFPEVGNAAEGDTWHLNGVESAVVGDGDCFPWPELAVSMPSQLQ